MARKRPTASNDQPMLVALDGGRVAADGPLLTRAEARALRRSAPLTNSQLKDHLKAVAPSAGATELGMGDPAVAG